MMHATICAECCTNNARRHMADRCHSDKEVSGMLRLSVNKDEYLMVGQDVKITFLGGNGRTLRLMIDAPIDINVARGKAIEKRAAERLSEPGCPAAAGNGLR